MKFFLMLNLIEYVEMKDIEKQSSKKEEPESTTIRSKNESKVKAEYKFYSSYK
jgi:hypothetical protein